MGFNKLLSWSQFLFFVCCATAQAEGSLFDSDAVLDIELHGPLAKALEDTKERNKYPFELSESGHRIPVAVRVRGNSRVDVCNFPPLRIEFRDESTAGTPFAEQEKLKLVTHCRSGSRYEQNVLEEYAAYRIFSLLSGVSFRTRLLRLRYSDTADPDGEPLIRYGFLIESDEELAARVHGEVLRLPHVVKSKLELDQAALVFVFHYLVANTDWSLVTASGAKNCCHNGKLLGIDGKHYLVPYDFDLTGLVAAAYAYPDASLGISSVRERRYRGYCIDETRIADAVQKVLDSEPGITAILRGLPGASARQSTRRVRYLAKFFRSAADIPELAARLNKRCID